MMAAQENLGGLNPNPYILNPYILSCAAFMAEARGFNHSTGAIATIPSGFVWF